MTYSEPLGSSTNIFFMKETSFSTSFCSIFKVNLSSSLFSTQSTAASNSCCTSMAAMLDVNRVALRSSLPWARLPLLWLVPYLRRKCCLGGHANFLSEVESHWCESIGISRLVWDIIVITMNLFFIGASLPADTQITFMYVFLFFCTLFLLLNITCFCFM